MSFGHLLVTGGAGFIGSNFIRYLLQRDPLVSVVNIDLLTYSGSLQNLQDIESDPRYSFHHADICDSELMHRLISENEIDAIVHFAAETHVDRSILSPGAFIQTNIVGTYSLLEAARKAWIDTKRDRASCRFHHVSTDEVFGSLEPGQASFSETTPYSPNSPYAASKASSDHLVRSYYQTYGLPVTISNCSNNYGPYQFPEKLIPLTIQNAISGKPIPIYGDGRQIRDWLYVDDHCEAIFAVLESGQTGESYNVGGNNQPTNLEIVRLICSILDELLPSSAHVPHQKLIRFVADRPGHDRRYAMDINKISRELSWQPKHDLEAGLRETVQWYLSNDKWVKAICHEKGFNEWIKQNYENRGAG